MITAKKDVALLRHHNRIADNAHKTSTERVRLKPGSEGQRASQDERGALGPR